MQSVAQILDNIKRNNYNVSKIARELDIRSKGSINGLKVRICPKRMML